MKITVYQLVVLFALVAIKLNGAELIHASGDVKTYAFPADPDADPLIQADFEVWSDGMHWRFVINYLKRRMGSGPARVDYASDGFDTYIVFAGNTNAIVTGNNGPTAAHFASGEVTKGQMPLGAEATELAVWSAFCANSYFSKLTEGLCANIFNPVGWPTNKVRFDYETTNGMVQEVNFYKPEFVNVSGDDKKPRFKMYPAPFNNGYVGAEYRLTKSQDGLPKVFTFCMYNLAPINLKSPARTAMTIGTVRMSEKIEAKESFRPQMSTNDLIIDRRNLLGYGGIVYKTTNFGWLERNDPDLVRKLASIHAKRIAKLASQKVVKSPKHNPFLWMLFILIFIFPLFILFKYKNSSKL